MIYQFDEFQIDTQNYQLSNSGVAVDVEPKVFDLLSYLVENRGKLVTRDELFEKIWRGQVVSDTSLSNQIKAARKVIGDSGDAQLRIKTVRGRGYQFVADVLETPDQPASKPSPITESVLAVRDNAPMVAVLPFQNLSSDQEQDYFCEGMSEDITTELSRFSDIQVIARHSAFQFKSAAYDMDELVRKLGGDYVVEGSVRRAGNQIRINAQLIDTSSQNHVWAERYDFPIEDVFKVQDDIIETVVSTMTGRIMKIEMDRARSRSTENLSAYEHLLRGLSYHKAYCSSWPTQEEYVRSKAEFDKAIELDPGLARAHAWRICSLSGARGYSSREVFSEYIELGKYALSLDENEGEIHRLLGGCYFGLGDITLGLYHVERAMQLSPNDSMIFARASRYYIFLGEIEKAKSLIERAIRLSPLHPGWYWVHLGMVYYFLEDYQSAIDSIRKNTHPSGYDMAWLALCYAAAGESELAARAVERACEIDNEASVAKYTQWDTYKDPTKLELLREKMALTGLPA